MTLGEKLHWTKRSGTIIGWAAAALTAVSGASYLWFNGREKEITKKRKELGHEEIKLPEGEYFKATQSSVPVSDLFTSRIKKSTKIESEGPYK